MIEAPRRNKVPSWGTTKTEAKYDNTVRAPERTDQKRRRHGATRYPRGDGDNAMLGGGTTKTEAQYDNTVRAQRRTYQDEDAEAQPGTLMKMANTMPEGTTRKET